MITELPPFYDMKYTSKEGKLTGEAKLYNDQLWQSLNEIVTNFNEGIVFPSKTTAEITVLIADPATSDGTVWFNSTLAKLQVMTAPTVIETITSV